MSNQRHLFHIVDASPWPLISSFTVLSTLIGAVMYFHSYVGGGFLLPFGLISTIFVLINWWRDVIRESTYQGHHTQVVQEGLRYGIIFFIASEVLFFFGFFWAFFHSSISPTIEVGSTWPPIGINVLNAWDVPFLNTVILLSSGATVTWCHHALVHGNRRESIIGLGLTLILAVLFTALQVMEYLEATFRISDGIYGSTFFLATGFHGFHVIVGTIFLSVQLGRLLYHHFTTSHHFGFEAAAWYWHFVDVVWLFLFVTIYWWGSASYNDPTNFWSQIWVLSSTGINNFLAN